MGYFSVPFHLCVRGNVFTTAITSLCSQQDTEKVKENPFSFCPCLLRQGPSPQAPTFAKLPALPSPGCLPCRAPLLGHPTPMHGPPWPPASRLSLPYKSRHSMAVTSTSSLGTRLQPRSRARLPGADAGAWHGAAREHRAVTANTSPTGGCAAGAGLLERGSLSSLEHGSLFHPVLPETVRWSFIIDLIHI